MTTRATPDGAEAAEGVLRHLLATLAYRASKAVRDVPDDFAHRAVGERTRTPIRILGHMGDLMDWAVSLTQGEWRWGAAGGDDWETEVSRFFARLADLDEALQRPLPDGATERLIQGPLADALTHVGQLAMLRGMHGAPVRPESYARAAIARGQVGRDQPPPGREFDGDASAR